MLTQSKGDGFALYNGVKLPNIESVWSVYKDSHPYAVYLGPREDYTNYSGLWLFQVPPSYYENGNLYFNLTTGKNNAKKFRIDNSSGQWALIDDSKYSEGKNQFYSTPIWTSSEFYDYDASKDFTASDPIPLDGMNVIEWDGDITGLESSGLLYKVSDLITATDGYAVATWDNIKETHRLAYNDIFGFYSAPAEVPFYVGLANGSASITNGTWFYADPDENGRTSLFAYTVSDTPEHPDDPIVHNITVESGESVRLTTAGKYCDRDIVVTASGSSSYVIGAPVPFTLSADSWNGTRYELYAYLYAPGEYGVQIGLPSSGGAANAQRVVKAALTIHSVYTYTGSDTTQPYCRLYIVAVDTPIEDIDIVLFGLTPVADTVVA